MVVKAASDLLRESADSDGDVLDLSMLTRAVALFCATITGPIGLETDDFEPSTGVLKRARVYEEYIHTGKIPEEESEK